MASAEVVALPPAPTKFEPLSTALQSISLLEARGATGLEGNGGTDDAASFPLPLIDLSGLANGDLSEAEREQLASQVGKAASEWGFFHIVNHGVPEELVREMDQQAQEFFKLPLDVKRCAKIEEDITRGYNAIKEGRNMELLADFYQPSPRVEALFDKVWPEGNPTFCKTLHRYCRSLDQLGHQLLELLGESLGLKPEAFAPCFQRCRSGWRLHHCPAPTGASDRVALRPHSDTGLITLLKQDEVGGLQVRKGDNYVDVVPVPGAFVVNIGDVLQAWSNHKFHSVEHRVLLKNKAERVSLVYTVYGPSEGTVEIPPELIDEAHPAMYRPFTVQQVRSYMLDVGVPKSIYRRGMSVEFARTGTS